jgi:hypothetical protein
VVEPKIKKTIYCKKCNIKFPNLKLFEIHNKTQKHLKPDDNSSPKSSTGFVCEHCDYYTSRKSQYERHLATPKHQNATNTTNLVPKGSENFVCEKCDKIYKHHSSLWNHRQKCNYNQCKNNEDDKDNQLEPKESNELNEPTTKEIIDLMRLQMLENQELRKIMLSQQQQIIELAAKTSITNTNTNCNNNNTNNTFNLQLFLNEKCKDAINISEFVNNVKLQLSDLEKFGYMGYVEGVSQILINNLKDLDTYSRPIHCSDLKREVLYIKDNNEWTKETEDKPVLKQAIKQIANKNIKQIQTWKDENPGCCNSESKKNDQYMKIVMNSMSGGTSEEQTNNISQIVKNVAKVVVIDKSV